ncbi:class I SAM-dependent methyltransferase [Metabacillus herbersteinensis]|uniref:Class I SAM-dependent methyltransferase n=1 Tax=Metabacillus herbersteinensis TaxID=283816 RepID=A0ABV6GN42_9BACI
MKLQRILPFSKNILNSCIAEGDFVVDATIGNGHDTLFLAELVGESGRVFGFDIQESAIKETKTRLSRHEFMDRVTLFHQGHEHLTACIPDEAHGQISAAVFNLGYLPGADKEIVTKPNSTIHAIQQLLDIMKIEGIIIVVIYHGHQEGVVEKEALLDFVTSLDQKRALVLQYKFLNQKNNPPFVIAIEKR